MVCSLSAVCALTVFVGHAAHYEWTCSLCGTAGMSCSVLRSRNRPGQRQKAGSIFALWQTGFSAWMPEALRKPWTGTLFGAGDVFGATDALQLAVSH